MSQQRIVAPHRATEVLDARATARSMATELGIPSRLRRSNLGRRLQPADNVAEGAASSSREIPATEAAAAERTSSKKPRGRNRWAKRSTEIPATASPPEPPQQPPHQPPESPTAPGRGHKRQSPREWVPVAAPTSTQPPESPRRSAKGPPISWSPMGPPQPPQRPSARLTPRRGRPFNSPYEPVITAADFEAESEPDTGGASGSQELPPGVRPGSAGSSRRSSRRHR